MPTFLPRITKFTLALLFALLVASIWFLPHLIGWDTEYSFTNTVIQLLLTLILLLIAGIILYVKYLHHSEPAEENPIAKTAKITQAKASWHIFHEETKALYKALQIFFLHWGRQKKHFLKKLPWYILLGHGGSGKTSLLAQANLNIFPTEHLPDEVLKNACQHTWQFTNQAVFLELPFEMLDQNDEDHSQKNSPLEYINKHSPFLAALLKFIRRKRRKNRLNGVVITLELPDIIFRTETKGLAQQQQLKTTLNRIYSALQTQIPIYLVFTKCDLIAGFREFFADLSKEEREQNWGIVFPQTPLPNHHKAQEYFNKEFDALITRLQQRLLTRLETERNADHRALLCYFPQQIAALKPILADLILQDETAQLRGLYFCSNLQQGVPMDRLMSQLSAHFNLEDFSPLQNFPQKKSFFSQKFFPQIVFPEVNRVLSSSYWRHHHQMIDRITLAGMALFLMMTIGGFSYSFQQNKTALDTIAEYLPIYQQAVNNWHPENTDLASTLPVLDSLKSIQNEYADKSTWPMWLEIYDPLHMRKQIDQVWQQTLNNLLTPRIASRLGTLLLDEHLPTETLYQVLKGYLVFSPGIQANPQWIRAPMRADLAVTFKDNPEDQTALNAYITEVAQHPVKPVILDDTLITTVRKRLRQVPPVQFAYYEIKQEAENSHNQLDLSQKLEPYFSEVFVHQTDSTAALPALYTYAGYKSLVGGKSEALIRHTAEIYRILGIDAKVDTQTLSLQMTPELWGLYNTDYIQYWQHTLADIHIVPFNSLSQAVQTLDTLLDVKHSPLTKLLHEVKQNTADINDRYMQVSSQFASINQMTGFSKSALQYAHTLKTLSALRDYLMTLSNSTNVAQKEFQDASSIMLNTVPNHPIVVLRHQAQQLPEPLNTWFTEIADNSMSLLLKGAHQTANIAWKNAVLPFYQTNLQGRFPLIASSENVVDMTNFGSFFGNQGIYANYFKTYLAPFIDTHGREWRQYTFGQHSLGLSNATLAQLYRASLITAMYFQAGDNTPSVQFSLQPRYLDPEASSINIQLANQTLTYRHGPPQAIHWRWPFAGDTQQVSFSFSDFHNQNFSRSFDGAWGWFRLLNATSLKKTDTPGHAIWTLKQGQYTASFDLWTPNNLPVFDLNILNGLALPEEI